MGAKDANFHNQVFVRMGREAECARIQELYLEGRKKEAVAAVPTAMVEDVALVGPKDKIRAELAAWEETVVDTILVQGDSRGLEAVADALS
jgi:hypothetical protein